MTLRLHDVINALVAFAIAAVSLPLFALIVIIYLLHGQTNIMFVQARLGFYQKPFNIYKFRTIIDNRNDPGKSSFFFGQLLRRTSLDEFPQLLNIMLGQMALVGPRPLPVEYLPYFSAKQLLRFQVKPGLTGLAQVNGRADLSWDEKLAFDVKYVQDKSWALNLLILLKTFKVLLNGSDDSSEISFVDFTRNKNQN